MKNRIVNLAVALAIVFAGVLPSAAQVELKDGRVWIGGERRDDTVFVRSCFKLPNHLSYTFTGQGGEHWGEHSANAWISEQQSIGFDGCRILLETEGWSRCEEGPAANDGVPQNCMFGSEPVDLGQWNVEALRNGGRPTAMHGVARNTLRWFFAKSQETGFLFEIVVIATQKHNGISQDQQTHVIRQTLAEGRRLQEEFPKANVIMSAINEVTAHAPEWTIAKLNLVAVRADRWKHQDGRTFVGCSAPAGFEPEQWPCGPLIADGGGANSFEFDVGPEPGKLDMGAIHPERDANWFRFPNAEQKERLVRDSRGQPWGFTESMFYIEPEDEARGREWYGRFTPDEGCCTTDWNKYLAFLTHVEEMGIPYFVVHDEKGVETKVGWPRERTRVDLWAIDHLAGEEPPPPPPPKDPVLHYDPIIHGMYRLVLGRPEGADPQGLAVYNEWFRSCVDAPSLLPACIDALQVVLYQSDEYRRKNLR